MGQVREATVEDIPELLRLAYLFQMEGHDRYRGFSQDKAGATMEALLVSGLGTIYLYLDDQGKMVGFLGCCVSELMFNDTKFAMELAMFVRKESRGSRAALALIKKYEIWAKDMGLPFCHLSDISSVQDNGELYEKLGYEKTETSYVKEVA